jgi:hypothetical protein
MLKDISLSKWIEMDQIKKILGFLNKVEDGKSQKVLESYFFDIVKVEVCHAI